MTITQEAKPNSYRHLTDAAADFAEAQERLTSNVHNARRCGNSWAEIGRALGISKQAAQQKYGKNAPEAEPVAESKIVDDPTPATDTEARAAAIHGQRTVDVFTKFAADQKARQDPEAYLDALGASETAKAFHAKALQLGLRPEVTFNAETELLTLVVNSTRSGGGWTALYQGPGAKKGTYRHSWQRAWMRASSPLKVDRYTAMKQLADYC